MSALERKHSAINLKPASWETIKNKNCKLYEKYFVEAASHSKIKHSNLSFQMKFSTV